MCKCKDKFFTINLNFFDPTFTNYYLFKIISLLLLRLYLLHFWLRCRDKIILVGLSFSALLPKCKYDLTAK